MNHMTRPSVLVSYRTSVRVGIATLLGLTLVVPAMLFVPSITPGVSAGDCGPYIDRQPYVQYAPVQETNALYGPGKAYCANGASVSHSLEVCLRYNNLGWPDYDWACAYGSGKLTTLYAQAVTYCYGGEYWTEARITGSTSRSYRFTYDNGCV